jgi:hypothetical protein
MSAEKVVVDTRGDVFVLPDFLSAEYVLRTDVMYRRG